MLFSQSGTRSKCTGAGVTTVNHENAICAQKLQQIGIFMLSKNEFPQQQHADKGLQPTMTKLCKSSSQALKLENVYFVQGKYHILIFLKVMLHIQEPNLNICILLQHNLCVCIQNTHRIWQ